MEILKALIADRILLLEADGGWTNYSPAQTEEALMKLQLLEGKLLASDFSSNASKLLGLSVLLADEDLANFADDFKNELFFRLREHGQLTTDMSVIDS